MERLVVFLRWWTLVVLLAGAAAAGVMLTDPSDAGGRSGPTTQRLPVLGSFETEVTGEVGELLADGVVAEPVPTPVTLTVAQPGGQRASIGNAIADRRRVSALWDGGRPLPITGEGGAIDLGSVSLEARPDGYTWHLDGATRRFVPGRYRLGATVAVAGARLLAAPRDNFAFQADASTTLDTQGDVVIKEALRAVRLRGPAVVVLRAPAGKKFHVRTAQAEGDSETLRFGPGEFDMELQPIEGGMRIHATFQGELTA